MGRAAVASGPPGGPRTPVLYTELAWPDAQRPVVVVDGRVEWVAGDSLDLERRLPQLGRLARLELRISADRMVLHPHLAHPERYRTAAPRGAPLQWQYDLGLAAGDSLPVAAGPGWLCVHLGGVLLVPRQPQWRDARPESAGVQQASVRLRAPAGTAALAPWSAAAAAARRVDPEVLAEEFVALGSWRVTERLVAGAAGACSLRVALAGVDAEAEAAWMERVLQEIVPLLAPGGGGALVCVAAAPGSGRVFAARRSALVCWPVGEPLPPAGALAASARRLGRR
jgi:hypothetical protein